MHGLCQVFCFLPSYSMYTRRIIVVVEILRTCLGQKLATTTVVTLDCAVAVYGLSRGEGILLFWWCMLCVWLFP